MRSRPVELVALPALLLASLACSPNNPTSTSTAAPTSAASASAVVSASASAVAVATNPGAAPPPPGCGGPAADAVERNVVIDDAFVASHRISEIIDPVWWSSNIYNDVAAYDLCLQRFSRGQRLMFALTWYETEVNNGGHNQFFVNSTGIVWPDALAALEAIGATENADILKEANKRMGGSPPRDRDARVQQLEKLNPKFDDLDDRFSKSEDDLEAKTLAYVRAHPAEFHYSGKVLIPKRVLEMEEEFDKLFPRDGGK